MAIIKLGATVIGIRGTLAGATYSANKTGPYVKGWARSANARTFYQQSQRTSLAAQSAAWRALTSGQRAAWNAWAALPAQDRTNSLGETFSASGFNWFVLINTRLTNIGRTPRTAPPTAAPPAAPALTAFQTPLLTGQGAFITYAAGQFGPTYDVVLELATTLSEGQVSPPSVFKLAALEQAPPSTSFGFPIEYYNRIALVGATVKSWLRAYRQTTEGQRSAAASAAFVSTDAAPFAAAATAYNGTTNYALRGADLTGNADSKVCTIAGWARATAFGASTNAIYANSNQFAWLLVSSTGALRIRLRNAAATTILDAEVAAAIPADSAWHSFAIAVDLAASRVQFAVDNEIVTPTLTVGPINDTIKWTGANHGIANVPTAITLWTGCLAQFHLDNAYALDLEAPNALRAFWAPDGSPINWGGQGAYPYGRQPILSIPAGDAATNNGSGGAFTNNVATAACGTTP